MSPAMYINTVWIIADDFKRSNSVKFQFHFYILNDTISFITTQRTSSRTLFHIEWHRWGCCCVFSTICSIYSIQFLCSWVYCFYSVTFASVCRICVQLSVGIPNMSIILCADNISIKFSSNSCHSISTTTIKSYQNSFPLRLGMYNNICYNWLYYMSRTLITIIELIDELVSISYSMNVITKVKIGNNVCDIRWNYVCYKRKGNTLPRNLSSIKLNYWTFNGLLNVL